MSKDTITVHTFLPGANAHGEEGPAYVGNLRKGELRGIIHINKENCVGCDTCRKFCPTDAIKGGLGAKHEIVDDACVYCGQCLIACPFNAIEQMSFVDEVERVLDDKDRICVAHPSPAVRVSLCEEFGGKPGELSTEQMVNALERLGFVVYDCNSSADQTIIEEGTEFVKKIQYWVLGERGPEVDEQGKHPFPHFTSCCPAWVKNAETYHADMLPHLSTAKSPLQMGGTLAKTWAAKHILKCDPRKIYFVSVTPCTAKIFEAARPEMNTAWRYLVANKDLPKDTPSFQDIDASLTARDIAELLRRKGINPLDMPKTRERGPLEVYTGAGTIFGVSGGVMEAALRTAYFALSGEELKNADIEVVRGHNNAIVEATIPVPIKALGGKTFDVRVCVVNGANQGLKEVLNRVRVDKNRYHFIEVMNCPGGCVNGGGQPVQPSGTAWLQPTMPLPLRI
ncbi:MAG: [Fe-Fe] hydrogenase large subunit C-terminal domain-containing protein [Sutterella sp.]|nr:[Fe-Fe] hydrogenase large subunit C-terminal domain-containing protein [Sutterella sp.]